MAGTISHFSLASAAALHNAKIDLVTGAPTGSPQYIGQTAYDQNNYKLYIAIGTGPGDWATTFIPDTISIADTATVNLTLASGLLTADVVEAALSLLSTQITDFTNAVSTHSDVAQNTVKRHEAVTLPASHAPTSSVNGLELNFTSQTLKLSQNLSTAGSPTFQGATLSTLGTGIVHADSSGALSSSLAVNADVSATAAIAGTKISPNFGAQTVQSSGSFLGQSFNVQPGQTVVTLFPDASAIQIGQSATPKVIQIGGANDIVQIQGSAVINQTTNTATRDATLVVNQGGLSGSSGQAGLYVEEASATLLTATASTWQAANLVRMAMAVTGDITVGSLVNVLGFTNPANNGTFPVTAVVLNSYVEVDNALRTDASLDETGVSASVTNPNPNKGYARISADRVSWELQPSGVSGKFVFTPGASTFTVNQGLSTSDSATFSSLSLTGVGTALTVANDSVFNGNVVLGVDSTKTLTVNAKVTSNLALDTGYNLTLSNTGRVDAPLALNLGTVNATTVNLGSAATSVVLASLGSGVVLSSGGGALSSGQISNANVSNAAGISYSKLNLTGSVVNSDLAAGAAIDYSKLNLTGSVVNADVSASAAIAYSKLSLVGSVVNADVSASAAIAYSKLSLTGSVVNADISASAAIAGSKILPDFGAQTVQTTGLVQSGSSKVTGAVYASVVATQIANYSVGSNDYAVKTDTTGGTFTVTLPSAVTESGRILFVKDVADSWGAAPISITATAGTVGGLVTFMGDANGQSLQFISDGADWLTL